MEKISLREKQNKTLMTDVKSVLSYRKWINAKTNSTFDPKRILGVVAAGKGAENYLPCTIPKIIQQISELELGADIIIGLNNGFECPAVIECFTLLPNVQVIDLYTEKKAASQIPAKIFENVNCEGEPYCLSNVELQDSRHRIFVVHQQEGAYSAGKLRVLGDIYGSLLLKSIDHGWIPPAILVAFDAESQFLVKQEGAIPQPESNGLSLIVSELQRNQKLDLLGANNRCVVYQKTMVGTTEVLVPDFSKELPPIIWLTNVVHGHYRGYMYKPGGGIVGRTDVMIGLLAVIAERYPGSRLEDIHLSVLAKHAGFRGDVFMSVLVTNRVPSLTEMKANESAKLARLEQFERWLAGIYSLEANYGKHNVMPLHSTNYPWHLWQDPIGFLQRVSLIEKMNFFTLYAHIKVSKLIIASSFAFFKIRQKASKNPDILQGSKAKADW